MPGGVPVSLRHLTSSPSPGQPNSSPNPDPAESIPTMLDSFQSREVKAGRLVELPCIASGYPNPAVRWIKDGRPLPADSRWTKRITGLTISDLRVEDSGTYICEVTNTFGSAEVTGTLTVIGESRRGGAVGVWSCCVLTRKAFINMQLRGVIQLYKQQPCVLAQGLARWKPLSCTCPTCWVLLCFALLIYIKFMSIYIK